MEATTIGTPRVQEALLRALPEYLRRQRWFGGKARTIREVAIADTVPLPAKNTVAHLLLVSVTYDTGRSELYAAPLAAAPPAEPTDWPVIAIPAGAGRPDLLFRDALADPAFQALLLDSMGAGTRAESGNGQVEFSATSALRTIWQPEGGRLPGAVMRGEQSNTSVRYGERFMLKFFRHLEEGLNPDLEIGLFLTERAAFPHIPPVAGSAVYRRTDGRQFALAILHGFVRNEGTAWERMLRHVRAFYEGAADGPPSHPRAGGDPLALAGATPSPEVDAVLGPARRDAERLGRYTAELHMALAADATDPAFRPEPFSPQIQAELCDSIVGGVHDAFELLRQSLPALPEDLRGEARAILHRERTLLEHFAPLRTRPLASRRTRIHGDYHLGQILCSGDEFVIIDFEGEPARPIAERRKKQSPLQDVAGMLRSFHYAAFAPLLAPVEPSAVDAGNRGRLRARARAWQTEVSAAFLRAYRGAFQREEGADAGGTDEEFALLLRAYLLAKAVYELGYELNNRPDWVGIPLGGIADLLNDGA